MSRYIDALEVNEVLGKAYNECAESALMPENKAQGLIAIGINYARNLIMDKVREADVKPVVSGEVVTTIDEWHVIHQNCSICGEELEYKSYPNFCFNCGADMRTKEDAK